MREGWGIKKASQNELRGERGNGVDIQNKERGKGKRLYDSIGVRKKIIYRKLEGNRRNNYNRRIGEEMKKNIQ